MLGPLGYVLVGYFALLVGLSLLRAVPMKSRAVQRLRAFFPSWKFFDDVGDVPRLYVRVDAGAWTPCLPQVRRRVGAIFLNAEANLRLAASSLLSQLVADLEEQAAATDGAVGEGVEDTVSYQLTHALVRTRLVAPAGTSYQFKVCLLAPGATPGPDDDMLVSPVYQA